MKLRINNWFRIGLISGLLLVICITSFGQEKKKTRLKADYFNCQNTQTLVATLIVKEKKYEPFSGAEIQFYSIYDTARIFLDKIVTNLDGKAILPINDNSKITKDSTGLLNFEIVYKGNSLNKASSKNIEIMQADLEVSFFQKDSTKYIEVDAKSIGTDEPISIEDMDITFYIKGTFSELQIGKEKTDMAGKAKIYFPVDMPGDTAGILSIVVKIEDDDLYGNVESSGQMNWGVPVPLPKEKKRGLGDTDAPLWMVYTLIVLLSLVWSQYLYVIYMIIKIKLSNRSPSIG